MHLDGTSDRLHAAIERDRSGGHLEWTTPLYPTLFVTQLILKAAFDSLEGRDSEVMKVAFADGFDGYVSEDNKDLILEATATAIDYLKEYRHRIKHLRSEQIGI